MFDGMQKVIQYFIQYQKMRPDPDTKKDMKNLNVVEERRSQKVMDKIIGLVREHRESQQVFPNEIFLMLLIPFVAAAQLSSPITYQQKICPLF